jgi:hypothetical protein
LVKELSDVLLFDLEERFEKSYMNQVAAEADLLRRLLAGMRERLAGTFAEAVKDPSTLAAYPGLTSRQVGKTRLRDYYSTQPEQNVSHWVYAVRRRTLAALVGSGSGQLEGSL